MFKPPLTDVWYIDTVAQKRYDSSAERRIVAHETLKALRFGFAFCPLPR